MATHFRNKQNNSKKKIIPRKDRKIVFCNLYNIT